MKIVALVKVGNESEIIESFVRYNMNFIDAMVIVSSCCIDNTLIILRKLTEEGYDIRVKVETDIAYDERYLDNKYMKQIINDGEFDLIVPLDSDEFITGSGNPREMLERLPLDEVTIVKWMNYAMCEDDDFTEPFIPFRLKRRKEDYAGNEITKVIIPVDLAKKKNLTMNAGRHSVIGSDIVTRENHDIRIAHYPTISTEQYKSMIFQESIKSIVRYNMGNNEGVHKYKQRIGLEKGEDIFGLANDYGFNKNENYHLVEDPLDVSYCVDGSCVIKYRDLAHSDSLLEIWRTGQLMAIKAYILEIEKQLDQDLPTVLIFGAGKAAQTLFNGVDDGVVNILAYIDNDPVRELRIFNRRLVIPVAYVRFFKYDQIVISSTKYYNEMFYLLIENGVDKDKISGAGYLLDKMQIKRQER